MIETKLMVKTSLGTVPCDFQPAQYWHLRDQIKWVKNLGGPHQFVLLARTVTEWEEIDPEHD